MNFRRSLIVALAGLAAALAPLVPAQGVALVDLLEPVTPSVPAVPAAPRLPDCEDGQYENACYTAGRDSSNRPIHRVCARDDAFSGLMPFTWYSSEFACAQTEHFAYLPGPGVCLSSEHVSDPSVCVNGHDCTLWVLGAWVLCDEIP